MKTDTDTNLKPECRCPHCEGSGKTIVERLFRNDGTACAHCAGTGRRIQSVSELGENQSPAAEEGWLLRSARFYCVVMAIPVGVAVWAYDWRGPWHITATVVHSFALGVLLQASIHTGKRS